MKKIISILTLLSFSSSMTVHADDAKPSSIKMIQQVVPDSPKTEKDVGAAISPLRKFQASPFTGVLLSPLAAITLLTDLNSRDEEMKLEIEKTKKETEAKFVYEKSIIQNECRSDKDILSARISANVEHVKSLEQALKDERDSRSDPVVWGLIGLAVGIVSAAATASAVAAAIQ